MQTVSQAVLMRFDDMRLNDICRGVGALYIHWFNIIFSVLLEADNAYTGGSTNEVRRALDPPTAISLCVGLLFH